MLVPTQITNSLTTIREVNPQAKGTSWMCERFVSCSLLTALICRVARECKRCGEATTPWQWQYVSFKMSNNSLTVMHRLWWCVWGIMEGHKSCRYGWFVSSIVYVHTQQQSMCEREMKRQWQIFIRRHKTSGERCAKHT
jgi:hypothetical protein